MTEQELTKSQRAQVASRAQAAAHKALREAHPDEYQAEYQRAKRELAQAAAK